MRVPIYEEQVICDNCGSVVNNRVVDPAVFHHDAEELDAALSETDREGETLLDEGDLIGDESELPVEILLRHVGTCGHCSPSP